MTFEMPPNSKAQEGINEQDGEFFITDPETLRTLEAREQVLEKNIATLESKIKDIVTTLSSSENEKMEPRRLDLFNKILEDALEKVAELKKGSATIH